MTIKPNKIKTLALYSVIFITIGFIAVPVIINFITNPSNNRDWNDDQKILPYATIKDNLIHIYNIRNFSYSSPKTYTPDYYDNVFDLNKIKRVWYVVEPFSGVPGSAHTFLSFEFEDNKFISISVEIRKEKDEEYSPIKGLLNRYEVMYVIADERDVIKLRSNYRNDLVYLYPANANKEKVKLLFLDMINRTNNLNNHPEFYNTITNNCTTNIVNHINKIGSKKISLFNLSVILPASSDKLAYHLGLIDTNLSFDDTKSLYLINDRATKHATDPDFSVKIRTKE